MCGIFAYLNHLVPKKRKEICDILLNGLARLEYRGYDSAGIAIDGDFNDQGFLETRLVKSKGKVGIFFLSGLCRCSSPETSAIVDMVARRNLTSVYVTSLHILIKLRLC